MDGMSDEDLCDELDELDALDEARAPVRQELADARAQIRRYEEVIMRLQEGSGLVKVAAERDELRELLFREQEEHATTGGVVRKLAARVASLEADVHRLTGRYACDERTTALRELWPELAEAINIMLGNDLRVKYGDRR
jgi:chromosome segregation ATPase